MDRYERVVFFQESESSEEFFDILDDDGIEAALDYMKQWHYPGEHETENELGAGAMDTVYQTPDGYVLSYHRGLDYAGLEFDTEVDE